MTIRTGDIAIYVILTSFIMSLWRSVTSYGQKNCISGISRPRPLIWYTTRYERPKFEFFEIFDLERPYSRSRSKVKVRLTFETLKDMLSNELNRKDLWQLELEIWSIMWFWRHLRRHCDVQWRRTVKKFISLESVDQDLWLDILLDMVDRSLNFSKYLTLKGLIQGQGQRSRSRSHSKLLRTCYHMNLTRRLYGN